jgi:hypothetical protein
MDKSKLALDAEKPKHPKQLGFEFGLTIRISQPAYITESAPASAFSDVVYVALLAEDSRPPFKKGDVLKIGQTGKTLMERWDGIRRIFELDKRLKPTEEIARKKWLEAAEGKDVSVWVKAAGKIEIPYAKGLTQSFFSTRGAEEEFLDRYYLPIIGQRL